MDQAQAELKRVLLIDDEAINLLGLKSILRREYLVETALSAKSGLEILDQTSVAAIISDQRMPGMRGTEFFASAPDRGRTGKRIILTGYPDDQEIQAALESGLIDAVLSKPLVYAALKRVLEG